MRQIKFEKNIGDIERFCVIIPTVMVKFVVTFWQLTIGDIYKKTEAISFLFETTDLLFVE